MDRNIHGEMQKQRNKESRSGIGTKGSSRGFLADTSDSTGRISTTKRLIMHDYTVHLLSALSGEVFVTLLQNDPVCMACWEWKITTSHCRKCTSQKLKAKSFAALYYLYVYQSIGKCYHMHVCCWAEILSTGCWKNISTKRLVTDVEVKGSKEFRSNTNIWHWWLSSLPNVSAEVLETVVVTACERCSA